MIGVAFLAVLQAGMVLSHHSFDGLAITIKLVAEALDSSCCSILYTADQFRDDSNRIYKLSRSLSTDFSVDLSVSGLTFTSFYQSYRETKGLLDCMSPLMVIIHEDEQTRRELSKISHLLPMTDIMWFLYGHASIEEWFKDVSTPFGTLIIAAREKSPISVVMYEVYRATPDRPLRAPEFGHWHAYNGTYIPRETMYNRRKNLEGMTFRTGTTQNAPLHSFQTTADGEKEIVGYFPGVWKELEEILNFTSVHYPSVDNVTGIREPNGSWNGLIGMLLRQEIDVAVSEFIMDSQRTHVVDFTRPLIKSSYQIFFKNVGDNYNWDAIMRPFHRYIWVSIFAWFLVASTILSLVHSLCCRLGIEKRAPINEFNFINSFFFHVKAICSQGHNVIPSTLSGRILYTCAYLLTCILAPSYSAYLISYLTFRTPSRPFDNLQSFLDDGTYRLQTNAKTAEFTYFSEATDPTLQKIYRQLMIKIPLEKFPLNTQEALDRVCAGSRLAHFGDMAIAYSYLKEIERTRNCKLVTLSQAISTIYSSMAVPKNNPYRMVFNHYLQKMEDYGLTDRILLAAFPKDVLNTIESTNNVEMKDVLQTFILLASGIFWSTLILIAEIIYWRWNLPNTIQQAWVETVQRGHFRAAVKIQTTLSKHSNFIQFRN